MDITTNYGLDEFETYLAHHGIIGQKWGVRRYQNADGTLTDAGMARYRKIANNKQNKIYNIFTNSKYNEDVSEKVFKELGADSKYLKEAQDILQKNTNEQRRITSEVNSMFEELRSKENIHIYEAASEFASFGVWKNSDVDNLTLEDFSDATYMGVLEDGQQSYINAYSMYAYKKNLADKVINLARESDNSRNTARKEAEEKIREGLSQVGADELRSRKTSVSLLPDSVTMGMMFSDRFDNWKDTSGGWYLNDASYVTNFTDTDKSNIRKSEQYVHKINNAKDSNTWFYVRQAADNLNLTSSEMKNLSQSDWDKINDEIAKLKENDIHHSDFESAEAYLAHHGIIGQKWGVRRYQNKDGSLTSAGKKRYGATKEAGIKRSIKKRLDDLEAKRQQHEENKGESLKEYLRRKPQKLYKHRDELTKEEINDLMKQIKWDQNVADISANAHKRNMQKVQQFANDVKTLGDLLNNTATTYNNTVNIYNGLIDIIDANRKQNNQGPSGRMKLPTFQTNNQGGGKKKKGKGGNQNQNQNQDDSDDSDDSED